MNVSFNTASEELQTHKSVGVWGMSNKVTSVCGIIE